MNYVLKNVPVRTEKPRSKGFTMAMDKGLSLRATEDFVESCSDFVDIVKLGWATSYVTKNLDQKL
jgi:phosphosulfolactate synthase